MFYSIKKLVKSLEGKEKGCNFALAFGKQGKADAEIIKVC